VRRALLLEDGGTCARAAVALLQRRGFTVTHRRSAKAARAACVSVFFELYLIDVSIPAAESGGEGCGLAFVAWVRGRDPSARVIVWSAEDHGTAARELGAAFVRKDEEALERLANLLTALPVRAT
jgi:ActR/RegA family two-component response regulator